MGKLYVRLFNLIDSLAKLEDRTGKFTISENHRCKLSVSSNFTRSSSLLLTVGTKLTKENLILGEHQKKISVWTQSTKWT